MFSKIVFSSAVVVALSLVGTATHAQRPTNGEADSGPATEFKPSLTREQVRAELFKTQREGRMVTSGEAAIEPLLPAGAESRASRAQVQAVAAEARRVARSGHLADTAAH